MSLTVKCGRSILEGGSYEAHWYIGNDTTQLHELARFAYEVFASGDELDYIKLRFPNLPYTHAHCRWIGETAKFIVLNL